ncbi:hypothetical protein BH11PSE8_BH11PSE8_25330 [soil metagenome]
MLLNPRNRICPSLIFMARWKTRRQDVGLTKGRSPSTTSISAQAPRSASQMSTKAGAAVYFLPGAALAVPLEAPRIALKKSLLGSMTITSDLLRKLERYASRLR